MRHLSTKIYLTIVVSLLAVVAAAGFFWNRASNAPATRQAFEVAGELAQLALAPAEASRSEQNDALHRLSARLELELALYDDRREPIASTARRPLPAPPANRDHGGWMGGRGGPTWAIALPDGRWLVASAPKRRHRHPALTLVAFLGTIAALVALVAFPFVRGLTRRLERLQAGVDTLGAGDLSARVAVEGRDEVARLAASFNRSAARIEELVASHKMLLANASHELRTPLSRIRLGLELAKDGVPAERRAALAADIAELDQLIDEILTASRLDALEALERREEVDLLALAAEEAARVVGASVEGEAAVVSGDPRLLRRLVRNLLDNARRYGAPPIVVEVRREGRSVKLVVSDAGEGIAEADRERVFAPFQRGMRRAADGATTGSGLGLALVRQIARRHGGEARVEPAEAGGPKSRIAVVLPVEG
jgi:signal transduction histidine kinase